MENGVYPEYLISRVSEDGKLRIAGQIDLLVKRGNKIIIGDWKTNKKIETKRIGRRIIEVEKTIKDKA